MTFRELLKKRNLTQTRLSDISGVSQSNLSIYCNYREALIASTMVTRLRLARALDLTVSEFENILDLEPATNVANHKQQGHFKITEVENENYGDF